MAGRTVLVEELHLRSPTTRSLVTENGLLILAVVLSQLSCSSQMNSTARESDRAKGEPQPIAQEQQPHIAPGHCRIVGTLVAIDSTLEQGGPCSQVPCRGSVRIDSILGYGAAFGNPISTNQIINVRFAFTLGPTTNDRFPGMNAALPGLQIGERFQSDLVARVEMGSDNNRPQYVVEVYNRLN